jgi:hypothetical protein
MSSSRSTDDFRVSPPTVRRIINVPGSKRTLRRAASQPPPPPPPPPPRPPAATKGTPEVRVRPPLPASAASTGIVRAGVRVPHVPLDAIHSALRSTSIVLTTLSFAGTPLPAPRSDLAQMLMAVHPAGLRFERDWRRGAERKVVNREIAGRGSKARAVLAPG